MARTRRKGNGTQALKVIKPNAAGIDVGSRTHWVCCPPDADGTPRVQEFGCDTQSLNELADWLRSEGVTSVAMESTGVYWIPLFEVLDGRGIEVILSDSRSTTGAPGRHTDVDDCQWIQQLHACGLLRGAFRPSDAIVQFRALVRMRQVLVREQADWLRRMQKELDQMNVRVHRAVADITGVTGMNIIRAIVAGERDPMKLASLRDRRCRRSVEEIARELTGTWREEHLMNLDTALKMYDTIHDRIREVDERIVTKLKSLRPPTTPADAQAPLPTNRRKAAAMKKDGSEDLRQLIFFAFGVDITRIDGVNVNTAMIALSEVGPDVRAFPSEKQFVSWLQLSPRYGVSGGRPVRSKFKRMYGCHRLREALRLDALAVRNSHTALGAYYRSVAMRKGAGVAVFAVARKLACYIYRMLRYGTDYVDVGIEAYEERCRERRIRSLKSNAADLGFTVTACQQAEQNGSAQP